MKITFIIIFLCYVGMSCALSRETNRLDKKSNDIFDTSIDSRKIKPYKDLFLLERKSGFSTVYLNPLHGIAFFGGIQSLVSFIVIKIKVVLVTLTIIGAVVLAAKFFGYVKYSNYFYKHDYPPIGPPHDFTGYSAPFPHHSPPPFEHDTYGNDWSSPPEHYARSANDRLETTKESQFSKSVNMTEIMYSFMNVNRDDCRARLICEFEIMLTRSSLFNYLTRKGITRLGLSESGIQPEDCTAYYTKCIGASKQIV